MVLKKALDDLWESGKQDFILKMFGPVPQPAPYMQVQPEGFRHDELPEILSDTDVLVAPSVWYETFGFTVLEALSFGVPVIVTDHVGARDVVGQGGLVIPAGDDAALRQTIESLDSERLAAMRQAVCRLPIKTWDQFMDENNTLYEDK